jgi:hypothetical protein
MKFDKVWAKKYIATQLNFHDIKVIEWNKSDCGIAFVENRTIKIPEPTTINRFLICLHEISHIIRSPFHTSMRVYEYEYDCEMYAIQQALELGLDIEDYEHRAKGYVMYCVCRAFNRGLNLDKANYEILDWLGIDIDEWNKWDRAYIITKKEWKKWKLNFYNIQ